MTITAGGTWKIQDWRYEGRLAEQARIEQDKRLSTDKTLAESDRQHSLELSNEQRKQAALRDRLDIADVRLSVLLDAADSASGCNVPTTPAPSARFMEPREPNLPQRMLSEFSPLPATATKH